MTRCIHCTRCVRFLEEIAGTSELGGAGRGDRLEIGTCVEKSINSELSGNIIDICPVGALTNKPFRFAARAWELVARPSIAVHDGVGSSLFHHVRRNQVLRSVPRDNEATNENWLSDRDRYSHVGLYADDRVTMPQVKEDGEWKTVSWTEAAGTVSRILLGNRDDHGADQLGVLMSPSASSEEYFLAQRLTRQLGSGNIDHRLREQDFSDDSVRSASAPFEKKIAEMERCDALLLIGCNPREEAPLVGHRIRKAWKNGAGISVINPLDWDFTFETSLDAVVAPQQMVGELASLAAAVEKISGKSAPGHLRTLMDDTGTSDRQQALASRLQEAGNSVVLLGQFGMSHPHAAWLRSLAAYIADATGAAFNVLPHGGNAAGAWQAGAVPGRGPGGGEAPAGLDAARMLESPRRCYLLWGIEPDYDLDNPARAMDALRQAGHVISVVSHDSESIREVSDVILPLAAQPESEGSVCNLDGTLMTFKAAGKPPGEARPGWKILRRLGSEMGLAGFGQLTDEDVRSEWLAEQDRAVVSTADPAFSRPDYEDGLYRIGEVPMYSPDALCRRSKPLQQTQQAHNSFLRLNPEDGARLGLEERAMAKVRQGGNEAEFEVSLDHRVPAGGAWLRCATGASRTLGHAVAPITVEVA